MDDFDVFMRENDEKCRLEDQFLILQIFHYLMLTSK